MENFTYDQLLEYKNSLRDKIDKKMRDYSDYQSKIEIDKIRITCIINGTTTEDYGIEWLRISLANNIYKRDKVKYNMGIYKNKLNRCQKRINELSIKRRKR